MQPCVIDAAVCAAARVVQAPGKALEFEGVMVQTNSTVNTPILLTYLLTYPTHNESPPSV